jgi:hypothetical protein
MPTGFENMEDQMLRKKFWTTHQTMSSRGATEKDIAAVATVLVSSEHPRHPIDYASARTGASRWIAAQSGEQTLILAFDTPQTIRKRSAASLAAFVRLDPELQVADRVGLD